MTRIPLDNSVETTNGSAWAAILAAAISCVAFGALVDLAEASGRVSHMLSFYNPAGDLSGKSCVAIVIWLFVWGWLHVRWRNRNITSGKLGVVAIVLILLSLLATFPPFFNLFAAA
ncbi:MAG TPA: hypothetical protein VGG19_12020 [Tepidisphaeraceae bacterium]|jgi:hypothetical protein